jgi:hypothetical protein
VPNPADASASLQLTLTEATTVRVEVFDGVGRRVAMLHDGLLTMGNHALELDASGLAPGLYTIRAYGETGSSTSRLIVGGR